MIRRLCVALGWIFVVLLVLPPAEGLSVRREHHDDPKQALVDVPQTLEDAEDGAEDRRNVQKPVRASFTERKEQRNQKELDLNELSRKRRAPQASSKTAGTRKKDKESTQKGKECRTRAGDKGHCSRVLSCSGLELKNNMWSILQDLCVVEGVTVGVCCPEVVLVGIGPDFSARLPALADSYDDIDGIDGPRGPDGRVRREERGCGISTKQLSKISGKQPAKPHEWPWMVALLRSKVAFCGGALITAQHVLTGAHNIITMELNQIVVRLGEYDFKQFNETRYRDFRVAAKHVHPDFDQLTYENDIAILKLIQPSFFNSYIWPVCLPPLDDSWVGYEAIVTGWGTETYGGPKSTVLMEVKVPIWSNQNCQEVYVNRIQDSKMCAGDYNGGKDACQFDSGGPLMIQLPNRRWAVVGIVSSGIRCGEANHPGIYTRVNSYIKWIMENTAMI